MSAVVLIGAQWGDEGKGKITDFLAERADMVVRYQGGSNAGHTVVVGDEEYKLHLIPSGILYPNTICVIGNGVVLDLEVMLKEIAALNQRGISTDHLRISDRAQVIMPYHRRLDELQEEGKGANKIGTTKRGIGPAYVDKASRVGIRVIDLFDPEVFQRKLETNLEEKNTLFAKVYGVEGFNKEEILAQYAGFIEKIKPYVADTSVLVNDAVDAGKNVLFEGAQGTLLDLDHGTYPFVTSSHPIAGGACIGAGIGPTKIKKIYGVAKAYTTRVGEGPFPTELFDALGEQIRKEGCEFGTTTGRPRRCGWFDAVIVRYSTRMSGLTGIALTKLDVLDKLDEIKICHGYHYQGKVVQDFPASLKALAECTPIYEVMEGWKADTTQAKTFEELPPKAQKYLKRIEELIGVKISLAAVGPKRSQTIVREELY
ncbi:adenylosuccinate synthase [Candidatus Formimonas warabiya]|uniref:Adenylosuccinate synthetase n=1 Tax=Formimonas warabiya TaxID=1761012 RepID=A0A3G1KUN2_FORW1|nr:adenylosuccinate synthase [Candidatus Formimonas warabiya]ATW26213.1 adenylosuccinate synthase [Candidatus Formimonas warabiya]